MADQKLVICLAALVLGCNPPTIGFTPQIGIDHWESVTVWNRERKVVSLLKTSDELGVFEKHWASREKVSSSTNPSFKYSFFFRRGYISERWSYDPAGYVEKSNIFQKPIYRIEQYKEFNQLLGIKD